jgi:sporulation protein YlmC with PRC-barrel domain
MVYLTGSELAGLAILTLTGGQRIGRIQDVVFCPDGRITGFFVAGDGGRLFLPAGQVRSIGGDALTIEDEQGLTPEREAPSGEGEYPSRSLHGRPVVGEAGTILGKIADIRVDTAALQVTMVLMTTGLMDSLLHRRKAIPIEMVRAIGEDSVIVSDVYDPASPDSVVRAPPPQEASEARSANSEAGTPVG